MTKLFTLVFTALLASYVAANPENIAREAEPAVHARAETLKDVFLRKWVGERQISHPVKREAEPETLTEIFYRKWLNNRVAA